MHKSSLRIASRFTWSHCMLFGLVVVSNSRCNSSDSCIRGRQFFFLALGSFLCQTLIIVDWNRMGDLFQKSEMRSFFLLVVTLFGKNKCQQFWLELYYLYFRLWGSFCQFDFLICLGYMCLTYNVSRTCAWVRYHVFP